jgi:hypothetical protein
MFTKLHLHNKMFNMCNDIIISHSENYLIFIIFHATHFHCSFFCHNYLHLFYRWLNIVRKCGFSHTKGSNLWHMCKVNLCGFIRYNVQYAMFIMSYIRLKLKIDNVKN